MLFSSAPDPPAASPGHLPLTPDLRHAWPAVDLLSGDLDGAELVLGDPKAHATWLRQVKVVSLRLAPDQLPASIAQLLGSKFSRCGHNADNYFFCRQELTGQ